MRRIVILFFCMVSAVTAADTVSVSLNHLSEPLFNVASRIYSPDGSQRIDGCSDGILRIYSTSDTLQHTDLTISPAPTFHVQFVSDTAGLLVFQSDSTLFKVHLSAKNVSPCPVSKISVMNRRVFSANGKTGISFAPKDSSHLLVDLESGEERTIFAGFSKTATPRAICLYPDGARALVVVPEDSTVQLRSLANDSLLRTYTFESYPVEAIALSPDAKQFVIPLYTPYSQPQNTLAIIDVESGDTVRTFPAQKNSLGIVLRWQCNGLSFSLDGLHITAGDYDQIAVWSVETGSMLLYLRYGHTHDAYTSWFTPDSKSIILNRTEAGTGTDSLVRWDIAGNKKTVLSSKTDWPSIQASGFSVSGDDLHIGCYYYDATNPGADYEEWDSVVCWNGKTGQEIMPRKYRKLESANSSVRWFFSQDGKRLIQKELSPSPANQKYRVTLLDLTDSGRLLLTTSVQMQMVIAQDKPFIYLFDSTTCKCINLTTLDSTVKPFLLPAGWMPAAVHHETSRLSAFIREQKKTADTIIYHYGIWNLETGICMHQFLTGKYSWDTHSAFNTNAAFLPDGNSIVVTNGASPAYDTSGVSLFDIPSGKRLFNYPIVSGSSEFSLSPDGNQLIVGTEDRQLAGLYCFDAKSGVLQRFYTTSYARIQSPFLFNPVEPRQFVADSKLWELPLPVSTESLPKKRDMPHLRITSVSSKTILLSTPMVSTDATFAMYRLDGREIAKARLTCGRNQIITLPQHAQGIYTYRFTASQQALQLQGKVYLP